MRTHWQPGADGSSLLLSTLADQAYLSSNHVTSSSNTTADVSSDCSDQTSFSNPVSPDDWSEPVFSKDAVSPHDCDKATVFSSTGIAPSEPTSCSLDQNPDSSLYNRCEKLVGKDIEKILHFWIAQKDASLSAPLLFSYIHANNSFEREEASNRFPSWIPPCADLLDLLLEFWLCDLVPFFESRDHDPSLKLGNYEQESIFIFAILVIQEVTGIVFKHPWRVKHRNVNGTTGYRPGRHWWNRYKGGLLRRSQIDILKRCCTIHSQEMREHLAELDRAPSSNSESVFFQIKWAVIQMRGLYRFLKRHRSERFELQLLKYLDEEDVDLDFVRELSRIDRVKAVTNERRMCSRYRARGELYEHWQDSEGVSLMRTVPMSSLKIYPEDYLYT